MEIVEEIVEASQFKIVGSMLAACLIIFLIFFIASRRAKMIPSGLQNALEAMVDFLKIEVVFENIGPEGKTWLPFIVTLFFFILGTNLIGLIPGSFSATSNINVTATLAIIVFFSIQVQGVIKHGFFKYIKSWIPAGVPVFIGVFMFPIEFVGQIAKPFSLAIRLFANMFAGHVILGTFLFLIIEFKSYVIAPFPLALAVAMSGLEILFSFIQAYIFTILSSMYIGAAIHPEH